MKKSTLIILLLLITWAFAPVSTEAKEPTEKSYLQHPQTKTLQPLSIWNPLLHTRDGKVVSKSYFQYGPSNDGVLKPGSLWNPIRTKKVKK